jgi:hypothetical protein
MALLEEAGRPLSTLEIKERLEGDRGVNNHFQIHPQGNLIRMGSGLWGLANRDVNVNDPQALLEQLVNHLQNTQEGIHSSEVPQILGDIDEDDAQALLGLIKQKGMRRDRAQYVYLSSWSDSRRIWPSRAIEQTLDYHPDGMTIEEVRLEVKRLTRRDLNGLSIGNMLFHTEGAFYNPDTGNVRSVPMSIVMKKKRIAKTKNQLRSSVNALPRHWQPRGPFLHRRVMHMAC